MDTVIPKTTVKQFTTEFEEYLKEAEIEAQRGVANSCSDYYQAVLSTIFRIRTKELELKSKYLD